MLTTSCKFPLHKAPQDHDLYTPHLPFHARSFKNQLFCILGCVCTSAAQQRGTVWKGSGKSHKIVEKKIFLSDSALKFCVHKARIFSL